MSSQEKLETEERGALKVPRLSDEAQEWAERCISTGMSYDTIVGAFLETFPYYVEAASVDEAEVRETLRKKFKRMRGETRRPSYFRIKQNQEQLKKFLDCYPVACPLVRLAELERMRQDPGLTDDRRLKVLAGAHREEKRLMPPESRAPFEFPGVGLPDLRRVDKEEEVEASEQEDAADGDAAEKPGYKFGGAMAQRVEKK